MQINIKVKSTLTMATVNILKCFLLVFFLCIFINILFHKIIKHNLIITCSFHLLYCEHISMSLYTMFVKYSNI